MSQSCWKAVPRAKFRPLILSPRLFQDHTASEPAPATLLCSRFLSFLSHTAVVIPGHGDKPLFPSQVPLSLPLPRPTTPLFLLCSPASRVHSSRHPGSLHSDLVSSGVLHCGGECWLLRAPAFVVLVCREPRHIMFLIGPRSLWTLVTTQYLCGMLKCPGSKLEPD